jgi:carboxymethylenebutenolidase
MSTTIDYYLAPNSPWTYLGHERFLKIAAAAGATVRFKPVDLGKVFPVSGGLPLAKRPPQRKAYRLTELARWRKHLGLPLTLHPKFFPVAVDKALRLLVAVDLADGSATALDLAGRMLKALWVEDRDIADEGTLAELLEAMNLPGLRLVEAHARPVLAAVDAHTQDAIDAGIFGAPSFVLHGEIYWGQDRLDFVERRLAAP